MRFVQKVNKKANLVSQPVNISRYGALQNLMRFEREREKEREREREKEEEEKEKKEREKEITTGYH